MDLYSTALRREELEEDEEEPRAPPQWPARFVGREIRRLRLRRRRGPWPGEEHDEGGGEEEETFLSRQNSHARAARLGIRPINAHGTAHVRSQFRLAPSPLSWFQRTLVPPGLGSVPRAMRSVVAAPGEVAF
jgi:hypothetical protein